jgi:hypothetical protein
MQEHGCSTLSAAESGHILARLAGLEKIISLDCVRGVLRACGKVNGRACTLSHEVMLWVVLGMGLLTHLPIRQVFRHARRLRPQEKTPARSSLCEGRKRLGSEPVKQLHRQVVRPLATVETPGAFYRGMRLMGIDGTILDLPDSEANQSFGRSKGSRGEAPFPQLRKVSLVELGTHVETAFVYGGWSESEKKLVPKLWDAIPEDALLIEDRGFFSYESWKLLHLRRKLLVRVTSSMVLRPLEQLSDGSYLAKIYPRSYDRSKDRNGILVRVIEYKLDDPQRTGHDEVHRVITNLFDEMEYSAWELIPLYHERWEEEMVFDEQKTHQDPLRAEKPTHLRSQTPAGVEQELYALSIGHFVIRSLMLEAAQEVGMDVDGLSFVGCFRILQCRLPECDTSSHRSFHAWYGAMLAEMREEHIGPRRNRINPRVIKRKMSKWNKKGPEHRRLEPLTKTFGETVVMIN